ncbi:MULTISPECIES: YhcH/YjgK/YiaL family protein [Romboutsia]|uniref:YhcH/YjgK/YiaL family protein n=1 Tax=Romboutsia TaxID=1501226 RepID=UPI000AE31B02|nr:MULTISPECIES: YhcH/YjgK/YiaL family protein [Romboutsia]MCH1959966.1 YhcH/YjgK/YiaL family protein [Romboutsia hominis]MCH1969608.1 YhcH/YjgK/YiaL family protein [Romboutsia hominis]MDB8791459.1 YhcH/YjgK/YiaL family protein [Romboutsia sp. 1001216sp1]MDB8794578.1 YhcH/YjgK/YiaL family protein [Romboutsia sp. 1001216sp1]MDB8796148.1 YhcH/YjgK/YiaL family protein [Romboutsia sp. 1001216sp1]
MIFGNIEHIKNYPNLSKDLLRCFEYANENDLKSYEKGTYTIDGKDIFVNIVEYETYEKEERFWEAHKKYIDIHLMIDGCERIDLNFIEQLTQKDYEEESDFLPLEGENNGYVELRKGNFLICYPEDAHMTAIKVNEKEYVKKAIFKIIIR